VSKLSMAQIESLWTGAGGTPGWAPLMAGIALAESSGTTTALNNNPSTGDYSVGLWQINYYGDLLSGRTAEYGSPVQLQNTPARQAKAAVNLFGGGAGISNWTNDRVWNEWVKAGRPSKPTFTTVAGWVKSSGSGGTTASTTAGGATPGLGPAATTTTPAGQAGGGQGGAPYTPSSVPGIPATAPTFPDFTSNPENELSRVLAWTTEFGGWALFIFIIFMFGALLMLLGLILLVMIFAGPAVGPVAKAAGPLAALAGPEGAVAGAVAGKVASSEPKTPTPPSVPSRTQRDRNAERVAKLPAGYRDSQRAKREDWLRTRGPKSVDAQPGRSAA